jgi:hypothetical protein
MLSGTLTDWFRRRLHFADYVEQGFAGEIVQVLADVDPHAVVAAVANHPGKETISG